jgi:hypothetical protein
MLKNKIPAAFAKHSPLTNEGLRKAIPGASRSGVHRLLQELKGAGKIYISGHHKSNGKVGGGHVPIYSLGNLPDAAKPKTRKEQQAARKVEALTKPEKVKYEPKDIGRPVVLRFAIKPMARPEPMRARPQPAGMWSGLMA